MYTSGQQTRHQRTGRSAGGGRNSRVRVCEREGGACGVWGFVAIPDEGNEAYLASPTKFTPVVQLPGMLLGPQDVEALMVAASHDTKSNRISGVQGALLSLEPFHRVRIEMLPYSPFPF